MLERSVTHTYFLSHTQITHMTLAQTHWNIDTGGVCIIGPSIHWKDMTSISFQMTLVIIRFSSPHHLHLYHLAPTPGLHIRIYQTKHAQIRSVHCIGACTNTCMHIVQQMNTTGAHIAHTSGLHDVTELSTQQWNTPTENAFDFCSYVIFPVMSVCVSLCLICPLVSLEDKSWRVPLDWAVTNPLTTQLTMDRHEHTEGM